jgi:hypothetical protein
MSTVLHYNIVTAMLLAAALTQAATNYVGQGGTPGGSYFTDIQAAVDASAPGDVVLVSNGVYATGQRITPGYALSNRIVMTKAITLRSVSGPAATIILGAAGAGGGNGNGALRGVFMTAGRLEGFTVSNGCTLTSGAELYNQNGGGVWLTNGCVVSNCVLRGNRAAVGGGGAYCCNGGTLSYCTIGANSAHEGGGVFCSHGGALADCAILMNTAAGDSYATGGGANCLYGGTLLRCTLFGNSSAAYGGGVYCYDGGFLAQCVISSNRAVTGGGVCVDEGGVLLSCVVSSNRVSGRGGGVYCFTTGALTNCLISSANSAAFGGGAYLREGGALQSCTIAGNLATSAGGGVVCSNGGAVVNTIVYGNTAPGAASNWLVNGVGAAFTYCCTAPTNTLPGGTACTDRDPLFADPAPPAVDYHLLEGSPCIDAGTNLPWMAGATDLDGNPRIIGGRVDMGCYEFVPEPAGLVCLITIYNLQITFWQRRRFRIE